MIIPERVLRIREPSPRTCSGSTRKSLEYINEPPRKLVSCRGRWSLHKQCAGVRLIWITLGIYCALKIEQFGMIYTWHFCFYHLKIRPFIRQPFLPQLKGLLFKVITLTLP